MKTDVKLPEEGATQLPGSPVGAVPPYGFSVTGKLETDKPKNCERQSRETSPFQRAGSRNNRLKLFLWGDSGVGKTTLALQFCNPVVIDLEAGTELYGEAFTFDVLHATTADEVMEAVDWLLKNRHDYRTLVIDPITIYWDALQKKWSDIFLRRNKGSKGYRHEFYDLQPKDWMSGVPPLATATKRF